MRPRPSTIRMLFERDDYATVVERYEAGAAEPEDWQYLVGALAHLGRPREAELALRHGREAMTPCALVEARFHLVSAAVRRDDWPQVMPLAIENRRAMRRRLTAAGSCYATLTLAFVRFASGRLHKAALAAKAAEREALEAGDDLAAGLAAEILGPAQVMTGGVDDGLAAVDRALDRARELRRSATVEHLLLQKELLRARYADFPDRAAARLGRIADRQKASGARATVALERARVEASRGDVNGARIHWREAAAALADAAPRRMESTLRARLALVLFVSGEAQEARVAAQAALQGLDEARDGVLLLEVWALLAQIHKTLGQKAATARSEQEVARLTARTGFVVPRAQAHAAAQSRAAPLNHRQLALLAELTPGATIDAPTYGKRCGVSEVTAFRDLAGLVKLGHLTRTGRARATRYARR